MVLTVVVIGVNCRKILCDKNTLCGDLVLLFWLPGAEW